MHHADAVDMTNAIEQLASSARGRSAMRHVLAWLDDDALALDYHNQHAILSLIGIAWRWPGTTRDAMRQAIGPTQPVA